MRFWLSSATVIGLALLGQPAFAVSSDIHIGAGTGTPCESGGCYVYGNEVNGLSNGVFDFYANSASDTFTSELIILGVPNNPANELTGDPLTSTAKITVAPSSFGGTSFTYSDASTGLFGEMTSGDVYSLLGLTGNNSNSFTNWHDADLSVAGVNAANFSIYLYEMNATILGKTGLDVDFSGLPLGTFVAGYALDTTCKNDKCTTNFYDNAFTEAGMNTTPSNNVPEPPGLAVALAGLLVLSIARWRRA